MRKLRWSVAPALLVGLSLLNAPAALAGGPPVVNQTDHPVNATETFTSPDPCLGTPAVITITYNGVEHFTFFANGTAHFTDTQHGTFTFSQVLPSGAPGAVYATGRFTEWDGGNGTFDEQGNLIGKAEVSMTLNGSGTRTDGTAFAFHNNSHTLTDTVGDVKLAFFKAHCN